MALNGGKFCIEKMLGFKGEAVRFFKHIFLFCPSLIQIELFKILGKLDF